MGVTTAAAAAAAVIVVGIFVVFAVVVIFAVIVIIIMRRAPRPPAGSSRPPAGGFRIPAGSSRVHDVGPPLSVLDEGRWRVSRGPGARVPVVGGWGYRWGREEVRCGKVQSLSGSNATQHWVKASLGGGGD